MRAVRFAVLAPGGQSGNFWIHLRIPYIFRNFLSNQDIIWRKRFDFESGRNHCFRITGAKRESPLCLLGFTSSPLPRWEKAYLEAYATTITTFLCGYIPQVRVATEVGVMKGERPHHTADANSIKYNRTMQAVWSYLRWP